MNSSRVILDGLTEFKAELRKMPDDLAQEAGEIVIQAATSAVPEIQQGYPVRTNDVRPTTHRRSRWYPPGTLRARVRVTDVNVSRFGASARVRSMAPHAHLFEDGTGSRAYTTHKGNTHETGVMPAAPVPQAMIPVVIRKRRQMYGRLKLLLQRKGFQVDGD